jgi:hypothetical protein
MFNWKNVRKTERLRDEETKRLRDGETERRKQMSL